MGKSGPKAAAKKTSSLRIISGDWRGRRLQFTPTSGLRPTGDRMRETLFNWLQFSIAGRRCLDLFAGSGALGLEALSRGAACCDFIELQPQAARQIQMHLNTLKVPSSRAQVHQKNALAWLQQVPVSSVDVVFLDPPFHQDLLAPSLQGLIQAACLAPQAWIYIEQEAQAPLPQVPSHWRLLKQARSQEVQALLYQVVDTL
ncbi:16S rRNA (guanine966-N2)-methyltransferase [Allopseudospirillum japonicum]|uniref:Ribosomal RNA small subunit methyltransferase D n=1 Tax=Allopseudospirillum japonicum TaxID=64971 RepID=A0A1H6R2M9_9GAMM|nr:16S rRNA (guanine(966)-N(2))-methyltransferase RsmD [Allopseudospirillum japonicum]SEI50109.1 16S rRNA (guanine966-N2)-methyltransferase [Allopseudospirillum japonicum]